MHSLSALIAVTAALLPQASAIAGVTYTGWDCCKPACGWKGNLQASRAVGQLKICNKNDGILNAAQAEAVTSSCDTKNKGDGYLCSDYSPRPVSEQLSLGFVVAGGLETCCKCYQLTWTSGPARGKQMQVQAINAGMGPNEFVIITPGGGVGPNPQGCNEQYGYDWGRQNGGVTKASECAALPDRLQGGCYWRWNWGRGDMNGWTMDYTQITCPSALTSISGCSA